MQKAKGTILLGSIVGRFLRQNSVPELAKPGQSRSQSYDRELQTPAL
jgi:hypothetical protein